MLPEHYEHAALTLTLGGKFTNTYPWECKMKDSSVFSSKSQTAAYPNEAEFSA